MTASIMMLESDINIGEVTSSISPKKKVRIINSYSLCTIYD
ncbi:hypothetical protein SAMN04488033_1314 [Salegentibacter agarivorans]|uniref:Uncharacterized protein n=1 Tax=Salegentibacter agarivorans TaxID=345907 RepID=A0A1I2PFG0_9FLAO|nr:hypothetical protein SAMN04488033_1314 [Salegentibacter agarivorans]